MSRKKTSDCITLGANAHKGQFEPPWGGHGQGRVKSRTGAKGGGPICVNSQGQGEKAG